MSNIAPDITVLIPCANRPEFLRTALEGVASQTIKGRIKEVIVSENSGVSERTSKVAEEFSSVLPIKYLYRNPPTSLLQHGKDIYGADYSTKYVANLHDDDWWAPEHLERSVKVLDETDAVVCYSSYFIVCGESAPMSVHSNLLNWFGCGFPDMRKAWLMKPEDVVMGCLGGTPGHYSSIVAKGSAFRDACWVLDLGNIFDNDRMLNVAFARQGNVGFCPFPSVFVRFHESQDSKSFDDAQVVEIYYKTTQWIEEQAKLMGIDFMGAFIRRMASCPDKMMHHLTSGLLSYYYVRKLFANRPEVPKPVRDLFSQMDEKLKASDAYYERSMVWRQMYRDAQDLIGRGDAEGGKKKLLDIIAYVEKTSDAVIILRSLLEVCTPLAKYDLKLALAKAEVATRLAKVLKKPVEQEKAAKLLEKLKTL